MPVPSVCMRSAPDRIKSGNPFFLQGIWAPDGAFFLGINFLEPTGDGTCADTVCGIGVSNDSAQLGLRFITIASVTFACIPTAFRVDNGAD